MLLMHAFDKNKIRGKIDNRRTGYSRVFLFLFRKIRRQNKDTYLRRNGKKREKRNKSRVGYSTVYMDSGCLLCCFSPRSRVEERSRKKNKFSEENVKKEKKKN